MILVQLDFSDTGSESQKFASDKMKDELKSGSNFADELSSPFGTQPLSVAFESLSCNLRSVSVISDDFDDVTYGHSLSWVDTRDCASPVNNRVIAPIWTPLPLAPCDDEL